MGIRLRLARHAGSASLCALAALASRPAVARGQSMARHATADARRPTPRLVDAFDDVRAWKAQPSDGVSLAIHADPAGRGGRAMRLDVDFHGGAGYAIARRELPVELPDDYEFTVWVRGDVPPNNLEFKLVDSTGDNVWWVNRRDFVFGRAWRKVTIKKRHVSFAWGPAGGGELRRAAAIELVVTAGSGGKGSVWFDDLALAERPPQPASWPAPRATASSVPDGAGRAADGDTTTAWRSAGAGAQWLALDFGARRELGGVTLDWAPGAHAVDYDVDTTSDGRAWGTAYRVRGGNGGRDPIPLPETDARAVRLRLLRPAAGARGYALRDVRVEPLAWTATPNDFAAALARAAPRGSYPRVMLGEQSYWTVAGVNGDAAELLINEEGMVETGKGQFSLEPFLYENGRLTTWADVRTTPSLADGYLPIPSVRWEPRGDSALALTVTTYADGDSGRSVGYVRYRVENRGATARHVTLFVALRPFQVNPPWQFLNTPGGVAPIDSVRSDGVGVVTVNGRQRVEALWPAGGIGAASFAQGDVVEILRRGRVPPAARAADPGGRASAAMSFALDLPPKGSRAIYVAIPLYEKSVIPEPEPERMRSTVGEAALVRATRSWRGALSRVWITLPDTAGGAELAATMRTALAHVLVNRDGPAIQPGSRSYERSWIRDGALTSAALLRLGHDEEVRRFIEWYAPYQYPNGKVPCCVDHRGADPVPEHDSHGELIYLIAEYWRYTGDSALVRRMWPRVAKAAAYIDTLRRERTTAEYASGAKRVFYGILPPSISHEGYSAKPMHSYWDDWFAVRGLEDAAALAAVLGRADERARFGALADSLRASVLASYRLAMAQHEIDFLPGSADLGDFDATSTTTAIAPGGETANLPQTALRNTFDRYWAELVARRDSAKGDGYTPYEWRVVGTLVRLGEKERALEAADFFMRDRRPAAWHQWAEVVWRDPLTPKFVGDMPHGWVASDFMRSALDLLAYDREEDGALVVGAGVPESWVTTAPGVLVSGLRTYEGVLELAMRGDAREVRVSVGGGIHVPRGGVVVRSPLAAPVRSATVNGTASEVVGGREVVVRRLPAEVVMRY